MSSRRVAKKALEIIDRLYYNLINIHSDTWSSVKRFWCGHYISTFDKKHMFSNCVEFGVMSYEANLNIFNHIGVSVIVVIYQ